MDEVEQLEKQVSNYKSVLAETEGMLKSLQASVESEESGWKDKLKEAEAEREELRAKNAALEESLKVVGQAEEV